ncbi:hypothetical protein QQ045_032328 [Rhodiola kirilowii]
MNALFNRHSFNFQGKIYERVNAESVIHERFDADSLVKIIEARLGYFKSKVFPRMEKYLQEILHMLHGSDDMTANVLFTETDKYKLQRILGTDYAKRILKAKDRNMFIFA